MLSTSGAAHNFLYFFFYKLVNYYINHTMWIQCKYFKFTLSEHIRGAESFEYPEGKHDVHFEYGPTGLNTLIQNVLGEPVNL